MIVGLRHDVDEAYGLRRMCFSLARTWSSRGLLGICWPFLNMKVSVVDGIQLTDRSCLFSLKWLGRTTNLFSHGKYEENIESRYETVILLIDEFEVISQHFD